MPSDAFPPPFPWFGGKARVADKVWAALGDVKHYVEPFAGSLAVLLGRPETHEGRTATVNDLDAYVANFWRAVNAAPEEVARHADWPVNETDLLARHLWLVTHGRARIKALEADPDFFDAKVAGWWVWGLCCWIGSGWCSGTGPWSVGDGGEVAVRNAGRGVNRKLPHLGDAGRGVAYMLALKERLRDVRVCCGDWSRIVTNGACSLGEVTGVFLDPPYSGEVRTKNLYASDDHDVAAEVREWSIANGDNPRLRIVLAGYETEHKMPGSWRMIHGKAARAYGTKDGTDSPNAENRKLERLWLSPACLSVDAPLPLFDGLLGGAA